jgi:hypothetical protein
MGEAKRKFNASERYLFLNNYALGPTHPISVDYTFLSDLLNLEKSYASDSVVMFRRNSHPLRKFHITGTTIRLMMAISRRFNTMGTLTGCSIHKLYQLMCEEYEKPCTKEQFYAEVHKFIDLGILSVSYDGIVKTWKLKSFKRDTKRFVLFSPLVFMKKFTDLPVAAQKLYLYIVSRNGGKANWEFKEYLERDSWLYTLTHKTRPTQIRELINALSKVEPIEGKPLIIESAVEKDDLGRWSLRCVLNPAYLVKHYEGAQYRMIPQVKIPYSKTVSRLRMFLQQYKISEIEYLENGTLFLRLAKLLHNASMRTIRFAASRIKDMLQNYGYQKPPDLIHALQTELQDRAFITYMEVLKDTRTYRYLGAAEGDAFNNARPLQFFRAVKDKLTAHELRKICRAAIPLLQERFKQGTVDEEFYLEDFLIELCTKEKRKSS